MKRERRAAYTTGGASPVVRIQVASATLRRLVASGALCVCEVRCLDCESRRCLWRMLLQNCAPASGEREETIGHS